MEPEMQNTPETGVSDSEPCVFDGVGTKNPTIHVLDSLMGMGKSTALINMIKADSIASIVEREAGVPTRRWLVIVPTLNEVDRYAAALSSFGAPFEMPNDTIHGRKMLHLLRMVEEGRNIVATHELFKQLSRAVYAALEALNYTLVVDEEIEVVRPYELPTNKTNHLFNKGYVYTDQVTRRVQWNSKEHPISSFPFKTDIPKLCEAGHLVQSKAGLLIVETPAEFLRCFDQVWVATYMFDGAPMRAYLEAQHFPIRMLTVAKDKRGFHQVVPFGSPEALASELVVKQELRRLVTVHTGRRNMMGANSHKGSPLTSTWFNSKARQEPQVITTLANSIAEFFRESGAPAERIAWTAFKGHEERMRVARLKTDCKPNSDQPQIEKDGTACGFLAFNARATNAYRNVEAMAYPMNVYQHGDVAAYFNEQDIPTSEDLYAISTLVQWLWRSRIRKEPREAIVVYLPSERMRGLFLEWLHTDSTAAFVKEKMSGARKALEAARKPDAKGRAWIKPKSAEPGFEQRILARIAPAASIAA
jgi:hypothetical protein